LKFENPYCIEKEHRIERSDLEYLVIKENENSSINSISKSPEILEKLGLRVTEKEIDEPKKNSRRTVKKSSKR
jgi:hypothetical protein